MKLEYGSLLHSYLNDTCVDICEVYKFTYDIRHTEYGSTLHFTAINTPSLHVTIHLSNESKLMEEYNSQLLFRYIERTIKAKLIEWYTY